MYICIDGSKDSRAGSKETSRAGSKDPGRKNKKEKNHSIIQNIKRKRKYKTIKSNTT